MPEYIVQAIIDEMTSRKGFNHLWYDLDADIQADIKEAWMEIVQDALD